MPRGAFFSTVCAFLSLAKGFALRISARRALRAWLAAGGTVCDLPDIGRAAAAAGGGGGGGGGGGTPALGRGGGGGAYALGSGGGGGGGKLAC